MKNCLIILVFLFVISCKNDKTIELKTDQNGIVKEVLFLDFYPNMSNSDFINKIKELNFKKILFNDSFVFKIDTIDLKFRIRNNIDNVSLRYIDENKYSELRNRSELIHSKIYETKCKKIISQIDDVFKKKYDDQYEFGKMNVLKTDKYFDKSELISRLLNKEFNFNGHSFFLYEKNNKVIVFDYVINGDHFYRLPDVVTVSERAMKLANNNIYKAEVIEKEIIKQTRFKWYKVNTSNKLNENIPDTELSYVSAFDNHFLNNIGLEISIKYFYLKDFEKLVEKLENQLSKINDSVKIKNDSFNQLEKSKHNNLEKL